MIDDLAGKIQLAGISADLARKSVISEKKKIPAQDKSRPRTFQIDIFFVEAETLIPILFL